MIFDYIYNLYLSVQVMTGLPTKVLGPLLYYVSGVLYTCYLAILFYRDEVSRTGHFELTAYKAFLFFSACIWGALFPFIILLFGIIEWILSLCSAKKRNHVDK